MSWLGWGFDWFGIFVLFQC